MRERWRVWCINTCFVKDKWPGKLENHVNSTPNYSIIYFFDLCEEIIGYIAYNME